MPFASLRHYRAGWLGSDLLAGLMLAALALPSQLATAHLAGMPPQTGLVAFAAAALAFAAFGGNRLLSAGADSTIAPIFAVSIAALSVGDAALYRNLTVALALMVGAILVLAGLLRAGWMADLLSLPVVVGFLAGISIHIIVGRLPGVFDVPSGTGHLFGRLTDLLARLHEINPLTTAIGVSVLAVALIAHRLGPRIPGALIGLVVAALATWHFDLIAQGIVPLGRLSLGMPQFGLPSVGFEDLSHIVPLAFTVAVVCIMQTAAVARSCPSDADKPDNISRDFVGVGAGSLLAGLAGAFAVNASPPNTAVVSEAGGQSQATSLIAATTIVLLAICFGGAAAYVPKAALDGVLIYIALRIFRLDEMVRIAKKADGEIFLAAASAALVVLLPIEHGVSLSIFLSLVHSTYLLARPICARLVRLPGTTVWWPFDQRQPGETVPGVLVFAPAAPLTFVNAEYVRNQLVKAVAEVADVRLVVIEASGVTLIDYTSAQMLVQVIATLRGRHITVAIARLEAKRAMAAAARNGLLDALGENHVFHSVEEAIRSLK